MRTLPVLCLFAVAILQADTVDDILNRMDQAAPQFHSILANLQMTTYTAIISDTTTDSGNFSMQRGKGGAVRAIIDFSGQKDAREIAFFGKTIRIYYPNLKVFQDYDLGKNSDVLNQFLLLGFGSSGRDLKQAYDVSSEGTEKIAGQDTTKLLLISKDIKVKDKLARIEIWIPASAAYPVQQQFFEPSGNYRRVTYSNIKLNAPIKGNLELKLPSGAKRRGS